MRNSGFELWNGVVEYAHEALETVRAEAVAGLFALTHGGLEIGGVLYGERKAGITRVRAAVPFECEHAWGPGFVLSETDAMRFRELLKPRDGMRVVGWYCSHTRSGVALNPNDCAIMERFFGEEGHVALLVKPLQSGPAEAVFHVQGKAEPGPHFCILPAPSGARKHVEPPRVAPPVVPHVPQPVQIQKQALPPGRGSDPSPQRELPAARYAWRKWVQPGAAVAAAVLLLTALALRPGGKVESASKKLGLQVYAIGERQVRIEWDRSAVARGSSANLEIADGRSKYTMALDRDHMGMNSITYARQSDTVEVKMKVSGGAEESVRLFAPLAAPPAQAVPAPLPVEAPVIPQPPVQVAGARPRLKPFRLDEEPSVKVAETKLALPDPPVEKPLATAPGLPQLAFAPISIAAPRPRSGRLIWTGELDKRSTLEIDGSTVDKGEISGSLPGFAARLRVMPGRIEKGVLVVFSEDAKKHNLTEEPSAATGWRRLRWEWDPQEAKRVLVTEPPAAGNRYARLTLRNEGRKWNAVVVEWSAN